MIGIYKITNKSNSKVYIGQSKSIGVRWSSHLNRLECNKHNNYALQEDYNSFGYNNFMFEILEECGEYNLLTTERKHIDINRNNCYNSLKPSKYEVELINRNYKRDFKIDTIVTEGSILSVSIKSQRIILMAYKSYYQNNDNYIEISATDIYKEFNIATTAFYRDCNNIKEELEQTKIFKTIELYESNLIILSFNDDFINTGNYITNDLLEYVKNFKNKRTLNVLLNFIVSNRKLTYTVKEFKEALRLEGKAYEKFSNITLKVLTPIIKEINDNTNIKIRYSCTKRFKTIEQIYFSDIA